MIYLVFAILSSTIIPILFKLTSERKINAHILIVVNYFVASLVSALIYFFQSPSIPIDIEHLYVSLIGIMTGIIYYFGFVYYQKVIITHGTSKSALFQKLGVVIPIAFSFIFFNESVTLFKVLAISFAILSIILFNGGIKQLNHLSYSLIIIFVLGGLGNLSNKLFEFYFDIQLNSFFNFSIFITAFILSINTLFKRPKIKFTQVGIILGSILGIFNMLSTYMFIFALNKIDTSVAFILFNVCTILLVSMFDFLYLKLRFTKIEIISFILALLSIVLLNL